MLDRASARKGSRYIGSGEAASYRRLPPLEPITALSWHVPLPVLRGPLSEPSVIDYRRLRTFLGAEWRPAARGSGEVRLARVRDRRVCQHVHQGGLAACEGSFQGWLQV